MKKVTQAEINDALQELGVFLGSGGAFDIDQPDWVIEMVISQTLNILPWEVADVLDDPDLRHWAVRALAWDLYMQRDQLRTRRNNKRALVRSFSRFLGSL